MTTDHDDHLEALNRPASLAVTEAACIAVELRAADPDDTAKPISPVTTPTTLAEALAFVKQRDGVPGKLPAEALSAVRVLEKVIGRDADQLPAAPEALTPHIEHAYPARHRIEPKRWANAISTIRRLLRACGLHVPLARGKPPSDPTWVALLDVLPKQWDPRNGRWRQWDRTRLLRFATWCSDVGIQPDAVSEQTLKDYARFRQTQTVRTHLDELQSSVRIVWNRSVRAQLPGWPSRQLSAPPNPGAEALPLSSFPASLQTEIADYLSKRTAPDAFDGNVRQWRPMTAATVRCFLVRAASLVAGRNGGPEHVRSLADIVTVDAAEFVLRHVYQRAGNVWRGHAGNYAGYLLGVARDFVRVDPATLARLQELRGVVIKRLRERRKPGLPERVSQRIMPFDDPILLRRLFQLPRDQYRVARDQLEARPVRAAQLHEQALMLDLLQQDPMRLYNLATLNFEENFVRDDRGRVTKLWISGERVKNGIVIDTPIPSDLGTRIRTHLTVYRPHLRGSHSPWLFPAPNGNHRSPASVSKTLGRLVAHALGVTFTPHMMRHILATQLYRASPHNGVVVQRMLRHTNIKTTEGMYGVMSNAGANAAWQKELDRFRRTNSDSNRRKKNDR